MSSKSTTGYIAEANFRKISADYYQYSSPAPERFGKLYDIRYINHRWTCKCPDARAKQAHGGDRCKHERALIQKIAELISQNVANRQAQEIAERAGECSELASLRAEVAQLRAEIQAQTPRLDLLEIEAELAALRAENAEIKRVLASKATARKKHMRETEMAMAKELINNTLDETTEANQNAIQAVARVRQQLKDLESIPYELKQELDRWTEAGKEELQPDYIEPEHNSAEVRANIRTAQETDRTRREATAEERRKMAPLNGNSGFNFYR